jgi:hypothetical protein
MNKESAKYPAKKTAKMPVISRAEDRGESIAEMEPLLIGETSRFRGPLTDLAVELVQKFRGSLPESFADLACRPCAGDELVVQQPHRRALRAPH